MKKILKGYDWNKAKNDNEARKPQPYRSTGTPRGSVNGH